MAAVNDKVNDKVLLDNRSKCWAARDAFFSCADTKGDRSCWRTRRAYVSACLASWVEHFDKKRADAALVAALLEKQKTPQQLPE